MSPDAALVFVLSIVLVQVMQVLLLFGVIAQLSRISAQGDRRQPDRAGGRKGDSGASAYHGIRGRGKFDPDADRSDYEAV